MKKKGSVLLCTACAMLFSAELFADTLQEFNITNLLSNPDATGGISGQTSTPVLITFYLNGAISPCYTVTLPYQNSIIVRTGIGFPCRSAVTSISFTPLASKAIGTIYASPAAFIPTVNQFVTNITINQKPAVEGSFGPVFDASNGMIETPGTVIIATLN